MANPPAAVKLALESICLLLGEETNDWKKIRQVIIRDNFISSIVNFVSEDMRYCFHSYVTWLGLCTYSVIYLIGHNFAI